MNEFNASGSSSYSFAPKAVHHFPWGTLIWGKGSCIRLLTSPAASLPYTHSGVDASERI